jgi:hypothetical protein
MRQLIEFYCSSCGKYFDVKLNMSLNGNHRVHCPNPKCGHIHFRQIKNGEITGQRFTENSYDEIIVDDLRPMEASCRDYQRETFEDIAPTGAGFLKRLWSETFSIRV